MTAIQNPESLTEYAANLFLWNVRGYYSDAVLGTIDSLEYRIAHLSNRQHVIRKRLERVVAACKADLIARILIEEEVPAVA
jgi:hypothetical protein